MQSRPSYNAAELDRMAAQLVSILDMNFVLPTREEKGHILALAAQRLRALDHRAPPSPPRFMYTMHEETV